MTKIYLIQESHGCCSAVDLKDRVFLDLYQAVDYCFSEDITASDNYGQILEIDTDKKTIETLEKYEEARKRKWYDLAEKYGFVMK